MPQSNAHFEPMKKTRVKKDNKRKAKARDKQKSRKPKKKTLRDKRREDTP